MKVDVAQVGKRWFLVKANGIDVEASYVVSTKFVKNETDSRKAGYSVYDHVPFRKWILTGKGARKHREEIVKELARSAPDPTEST